MLRGSCFNLRRRPDVPRRFDSLWGAAVTGPVRGTSSAHGPHVSLHLGRRERRGR